MELTALQQLVHQMYIAYYQRPADPDGLQYWVDQLEQNGDWTAVSAAFGAPENEENQALYGDLTREETIAAIYQSAFNRAAVAEEIEFWAASEFSATNLAFAIVNGAQNDDLATVNNKVAFSAELVAQLETNAAYAQLEDPKALLAAVTSETDVTADYVSNAVASGTVGQTFSLTADIDDLTGTAGNDTFSAGLTVAGSQTLNSFDTIDGGAGTDVLNASLIGDAAPTLNSVENLFIRSVSGENELDLEDATGVEQVWNDRSQTDLNVFNVQNAVTIGVQNVTATAAGAPSADYTLTYADNALESTTANQNIVLNGAQLAALNVNVGGADEITTAAISVSGENTVTSLALGANLAELTLSGEGSLTVGNAQGANVINASEVAGNVELELAATANDTSADAADRAVTLGAGDDTLDVSALNLADVTVDGGEGSDTLVIRGSDAALTDSLVTNVSNFESLTIAGLNQAVGYQTLSGLGFGDLTIRDANAGTVNGLNANSTLTLANTNGDADSITLGVTGALANDNAEFSFATVGARGENSTFNVTINDVENLTISTADAQASVFQTTTLAITSTALENLTVTGDEAVVFDGTGNTALESVDASGVTAASERGDIAADFANDEFAAEITVDAGVEVIGSAGADLINFGLESTATGGEGNDVFAFSTVDAASNTNFATITDFGTGDNIVFGDGSANDLYIDTKAELGTGGGINNLINVTFAAEPGATATFSDFLEAALGDTAGDADAQVNFGELGYFQFGGNTYVVANTATDGSTAQYNAETGELTDGLVLELTGSVDLSEFAYTAIA